MTLPLGEFGLQQIAKGIDRRRVVIVSRCHADANGACQFAVEIDAENPGVRQIVEAVGQSLIGARLDGALMQIGSVSQAVDGFFFSFRFCQAIVDLIEQPNFALKRPVGRFLRFLSWNSSDFLRSDIAGHRQPEG